jgi:uncharacterized membrane protein HdeD (DUF308 family)
MTPRFARVALICAGAIGAIFGLIFACQTASGDLWLCLFLAFGGLVLMICGYFIGKRKSWE